MSVQGLRVYRSNRLERLAEALAEQLAEPPEDPFAPECILVPGRGVAQWLSLELSQRFGVWANVLYLYPRNFVGWALERVLEAPAAGLEAFDPERLLWSIVSTLRPLLGRPEFEAIQRYVSADASDVRYFELCRRIASTFDRYAAYRPDLLTSWERKARPSTELPQLGLFGAREPQDEAQGWQALLWKALVERSGSVAMGTLERRFLRRVQRSQRLDNLPARISCFGVTHVPPSYARILVALCPHVPVRMFQLAASRRVEPARHNPLLESLGALATDFEALLADELKQQGVAVSSVALFEPPAAPTRLARLQRELLEDVAPVPSHTRGAAEDESIRIHVCHSPMREVEVLHDQLLALLSSDSGYEARDVVVMMPDIETYAPLIDAVFRRSGDDPQRIPYSLADRVLEAAAPVASALDRLFLLAGQRLSTSQVLDLLALEVVAARFEITPRDLEQITEWLQRTNVRWGIDADHREAHGHPRSDANTWRLGVRRLLLGYAMSSDPPALVSGILPEPGPSGSGAAALGKLASFLETLFQHLDALAQPHRASEWPELVSAALDALVQHDADTAWQHQELLEALRALTGRAIEAGYEQPIGSAALHGLLFEAVNGGRPARGFLLGGVTFCSLVPLRSIPFRVVCLVGLGDGDFPRQDSTTDFDLIVHGPGGRRRGDRSRRMEDRYIFLEAILAARERLIITYTGQSIRDNSSLPPSVVVAELCDTLDAWREPAPAAPKPEQSSAEPSAVSPGESAPDYIVSHPLQAFSPRYFDASDPRLFSYAAHYAAANRARYRAPLGEFFVGPLAAPAPDALALAELVRFYRGPAAYLLNRRLELYLRESGEVLADREPLELSGLESYAVGQSLLELGRRGVSPAQARELVMAGGALPLGTPGELDFQEIASCANVISELAAEARDGGRQPPLPFEARLPSGRVLFGSLNESYARGLVEQQFARIRASHLLSLWIRHLVYCWVAPGGSEAQSSLFGRPLQGGGAVHQRFRTVHDPALRLDALARRFDQGQALPLLLFPTTSLAYARGARAGGKRDPYAGLDKEWQLELQRDSHLQRVYGADMSFAELRRAHQAEFEQLALEIFEPLLEHLESEEHGEA